MKALNENIHHVLLNSARIVQSELWNDAGVIGAGLNLERLAMSARQKIKSN